MMFRDNPTKMTNPLDEATPVTTRAPDAQAIADNVLTLVT